MKIFKMMWIFWWVPGLPTNAFGSADAGLPVIWSPRSREQETKSSSSSSTTLSPEEIMQQILIKHGIAPVSSPSLSGTKRKPRPSTTTPPSTENIMEQLYKQHNIASASSQSTKRTQSQSPSGDSTSKGDGETSALTKVLNQHSTSMEKILQQHGSSASSSPSKTDKLDGNSQSSMNKVFLQHSAPSQTMQHIMHQHAVLPKPVKAPTKTPTSVSAFMQPLLKQLSPVGAGLGVVLAPILLINGLMSFFGGIEKFFSTFVQSIYKPPRIQGPMQPQGANFRPFPPHGPAMLKRQPRVEENPISDEIEEFLEVLLKAFEELKE